MSETETLHITVDPEHGGLRFAVLGSFILVGVGGFLIAGSLLSAYSFGGILAAAIGVIASVLVTRVVESRLKQRWPSGRTLEVSPTSIRLALKGQTQREVDPTQHVNVLTWRFPITRRTRIPKGWFVVALGLMQEHTYIAVYTFMSPEEFKSLPLADGYTILTPPKKQESDIRLAGQQRRLREAEIWRWNEGAEISNEAFLTYFNHLKTHFPVWMVQEG